MPLPTLTVQLLDNRFGLRAGLVMGVLSCLLFSACPAAQEHSIQDDLEQYLEKKRDWLPAENRMNAAIEIVRRDHFVHDDLTINVLTPFIGLSQDYIRELEAYQPRTLPVSNIHQQYTEGWRAHQFAIAAAVDAAERQDYVQLSSANKDLFQAQQVVQNTNASLKQLAERAGLHTPAPADQGPAEPPTASDGPPQ